MAIEFKCSHCGAVLRAPDGTEGKKAQCKSCGAIVPIVAGGTSPPAVPAPGAQQPAFPPQPGFPPSFPPPPPGGINPLPQRPESEPRFPDFGRPATAPGSTNPFAAPRGMAAVPQAAPPEADGRDGPPWERDGKSISSLWATFLCAHRSRDFLFDQMRREGGLGAPLAFALLTMIPFLAEMVLFYIGLGLFLTSLDVPDAQVQGAGMIAQAFFQLIQYPVSTLIGIFIWAALQHLMLMLLKGANYPFEATFRTMAYTQGVINLWAAVPCLGWIVAPILAAVLLILGHSKVQRTSQVNAALAVFVPWIICCLACSVPLILLFGLVGMGAAVQ